MKYLLDTNTAIYAFKKHLPIIQKLKDLSPEDVSLSVITLAELYFGALKSRWPKKSKLQLDRFVSPSPILPFDEKCVESYAQIRFYLERNGTPISERDTQIAAIAKAWKMKVVTHNTREFTRVPGILVEYWY